MFSRQVFSSVTCFIYRLLPWLGIMQIFVFPCFLKREAKTCLFAKRYQAILSPYLDIKMKLVCDFVFNPHFSLRKYYYHLSSTKAKAECRQLNILFDSSMALHILIALSILSRESITLHAWTTFGYPYLWWRLSLFSQLIWIWIWIWIWLLWSRTSKNKHSISILLTNFVKGNGNR